MITGNTECTYCNQAHLNCYETCPNSPARKDNVLLNTIFTVLEKGGTE